MEKATRSIVSTGIAIYEFYPVAAMPGSARALTPRPAPVVFARIEAILDPSLGVNENSTLLAGCCLLKQKGGRGIDPLAASSAPWTERCR
ncbi:MAG: hypothetical protein CM15mP74_26920 [Halieaceae bacterium]|nr:MAG: hypothetical protein CM15mP74_26920 [Halieaceae bacterium]